MEEYYLNCKKLKKLGFENNKLNNYENFKGTFTESEFKEIINEKQRRKNKRKRVMKKYDELKIIYENLKIPGKKIVFGTCTFDDKNLLQSEKNLPPPSSSCCSSPCRQPAR